MAQSNHNSTQLPTIGAKMKMSTLTTSSTMLSDSSRAMNIGLDLPRTLTSMLEKNIKSRLVTEDIAWSRIQLTKNAKISILAILQT